MGEECFKLLLTSLVYPPAAPIRLLRLNGPTERTSCLKTTCGKVPIHRELIERGGTSEAWYGGAGGD